MFRVLFLHELEHEDIFQICDSVPLIKNTVGWLLLERFVDLTIVRYLLIISRNHFNKLLLI